MAPGRPRALPLLPLLLLLGLGAARGEESAGPAVAALRPPQRRYSEATLASDYSRAMDRVLQKNFVEWLLARRERHSPEATGPLRRAAEPREGPGEARPSFAALEGPEGLGEFLEREFRTWLRAAELCGAAAA